MDIDTFRKYLEILYLIPIYPLNCSSTKTFQTLLSDTVPIPGLFTYFFGIVSFEVIKSLG